MPCTCARTACRCYAQCTGFVTCVRTVCVCAGGGGGGGPPQGPAGPRLCKLVWRLTHAASCGGGTLHDTLRHACVRAPHEAAFSPPSSDACMSMGVLRRYGNFDVYVRSSALDRSIMSGLCFFNGIFPASNVPSTTTYLPTGAQVRWRARMIGRRMPCRWGGGTQSRGFASATGRQLGANGSYQGQEAAACGTCRSLECTCARAGQPIHDLPLPGWCAYVCPDAREATAATLPASHHMQVVPIYTQSDPDDVLIRAYTKCPAYEVCASQGKTAFRWRSRHHCARFVARGLTVGSSSWLAGEEPPGSRQSS